MTGLVIRALTESDASLFHTLHDPALDIPSRRSAVT